MDNTEFYVLALIVIIAAAFILRKVVSCMFRASVIVIAVAIIAALYLYFTGQLPIGK